MQGVANRAPRIKFCGITSVADAELAVANGAWAIGLILWPESKRACDPGEGIRIGNALRRKVEVVGVFVNETLDTIAAAAEREQLGYVQLHGDEGPSFCAEVARRTGCKVIKAFRVGSSADVRGAAAFRTDFHLFDTYRPSTPGGTGESFDWELVRRRKSPRRGGIPAIVAGGLTPDNVAEAIHASNPWAVDVAGGVEIEGRPGIKDHDLMRSFIEAAHLAEDPDDATRNDLQPEKTPEDKREVHRRDRGEPSRA
jgi:phosphoribosylanthranilate isomerase